MRASGLGSLGGFLIRSWGDGFYGSVFRVSSGYPFPKPVYGFRVPRSGHGLWGFVFRVSGTGFGYRGASRRHAGRERDGVALQLFDLLEVELLHLPASIQDFKKNYFTKMCSGSDSRTTTSHLFI